ncbi:unnamed protein product [marine sediment metagenome]|uniref:Uracil-DNA glycosylase-like domain-containing protein n=1 Tax=marine sediment metagenome TaxID=412755 RepID=X1CTT3_9ZZZZ
MNIPQNCKNCHLHEYRSKIVIGRGTVPADILFMGEAPGLSEDSLGEAFIGKAGELLDIMLSEALELSNIEVMPTYYITNTVLCRPCDKIGGENRPPTKEEVLACKDNVLEIITVVNASCNVLIGKTAEKYYSKLLANYFTIQHPAYLLRGGGVEHPYYKRNVRVLSEVLNQVKEGK